MSRQRLIYPSLFGGQSKTRRRFLQGSAAAIAGIALANCTSNRRETPTSTPSTPSTPSSTSKKLNVYTWADYRNDEVIKAFTEKTGIEVTVDVYDSNETMLAKMQAGGGNAYSVIYPSDYMVQQMIELGMLTPLDKDRIKGLENLFDKWDSPAYDSDNTFSVPFAWGTTGLLYNSELVTDQPTDWDDLWENRQKFSKKMSLLDDPRETLGATLKSLGYSYNSTDPKQLEEAYNRLVEIKPDLASFQSFGYEDALFGGDLAILIAFSVDAIAATLEDDRIKYVIPASGSSVWTDTMIIPNTAPDVDAAYEWINFNLDPAVCKMNVEILSSATPNKVTYDSLSNEIKSNTNLFPPEDLLAKCEGIAPLPEEALGLMDEYWTKLTSA
jgi:spermidine/putrescine transport system substrate-binding protein